MESPTPSSDSRQLRPAPERGTVDPRNPAGGVAYALKKERRALGGARNPAQTTTQQRVLTASVWERLRRNATPLSRARVQGGRVLDRHAIIDTLWTAKRGRRITATTYLIGRAMLRRARPDGRLWPSKRTLASDVGCSEKTVERALNSLLDLGLLAWRRRRAGLRRFTSNLYTLVSPLIRKKEKTLFEYSQGKMSHGEPHSPGPPSAAQGPLARGARPGSLDFALGRLRTALKQREITAAEHKML